MRPDALARDPGALARSLLAFAATAPDPVPLVEAARALLALAKAHEEGESGEVERRTGASRCRPVVRHARGLAW